jgi:hypothetical protein
MPPASLDRRLTPARSDLAAAYLSALVEAPRYAEGRAMQVVEASAPLRRAPHGEAPLETEALHGESVMVYEESEGWAWAQLDRDHYVGYLPLSALGTPIPPTDKVAVLRTHAYPGRSIKLPPVMALSLGSRLAIVRRDGDFAVTQGGLHLWARHLADLNYREPDFSKRPISGAVGPRKASIARASSRLGSPPSGFRLRATATCSRLRSASRPPSRAHGRAAISCSGRAMSESCGIP